MSKIRYADNITFLMSASCFDQLPADFGGEVAFIGRSNVGKSSALNVISGIKNLAKVGKTPGVTRLINVFPIDARRRFIDLPGYGYAKVSGNVKDNWHDLVNQYLVERKSLKGLILLVDSRHLLGEHDWEIINWVTQAKLPTCILLTKVDKLTNNERISALRVVKSEIEKFSIVNLVTVVPFSVTKRIGLDEVFNWLRKVF